MASGKNIEKICAFGMAFTLLFTLLLMHVKKLGLIEADVSPAYETILFDDSKVHTIDLVCEDFERLIESAASEEYYPASVIIDGEAFQNVGIRA